MYIYVIDDRWPGGTSSTSPNDPKNAKKEKITIDPMESIPSIVSFIKNKVNGEESIDLLRLVGHGNKGYLQIGRGLDAASAIHFSALAGLFGSFGMIEIHGCGVASGTSIIGRGDPNAPKICQVGTADPGGAGHIFLSALASAAKCPVKAAINCQFADSLFRFEGPTMTVNPPAQNTQRSVLPSKS